MSHHASSILRLRIVGWDALLMIVVMDFVGVVAMSMSIGVADRAFHRARLGAFAS
jgi:hypothetical protein